MERPAGVTAIASLFLLAAGYVLGLGLIMLLRPGAVSLMLGSPLLGGLELAGPYMFLLLGSLAGVIGAGLLRLHNWARRLGALAALVGLALLIPEVSVAVVNFRPARLAWGGLGIVVRVIIAWYLYQPPAAEAFAARPGSQG